MYIHVGWVCYNDMYILYFSYCCTRGYNKVSINAALAGFFFKNDSKYFEILDSVKSSDTLFLLWHAG